MAAESIRAVSSTAALAFDSDCDLRAVKLHRARHA